MAQRNSVYLAGRVTGLGDRGGAWRDEAARLLDPIPVLDPLRLELPSHRPQDIVRTDVAAIASSAAVLAYVGRESWGTAMELWVAKQLQVPVFAWVEPGFDGPLSPWLVYVCGRGVAPNLRTAIGNLLTHYQDHGVSP
jgi:nucleoside 2-deoxyribosyltransferase